MQDDDNMLVFSRDGVINLDQLGDLDDYGELVRDIEGVMNKGQPIPDEMFKRIANADSDYLFQEEGFPKVLRQILTNIQQYPKQTDCIYACAFQYCECCFLSRQLQDQGVMTIFVTVLNKHQGHFTRILWLNFLRRLTNKLSYVDDQQKQQEFLKFFVVLMKDHHEPTQKQSYLIVQVVDGLLRHRWARKSLRHFEEEAKNQQHASTIVKYFLNKYSNYAKK